MDTFLVRISKRVTPVTAANQQFEAGLHRVLAALPGFETPFEVVTGTASGGASGLHIEWAASLPKVGASLVQVHQSELGAVLAFGDTAASGACAKLIWNAYISGGVTTVRELDGCFSAIIFDTQSATVTVLSDMIGQRALRMAETESDYILSPHDACLVACGAVSIDFDATDLLACLVVENSLQRRSLLRGVVGLEGNDVLTFGAAQAVVRTRLPKIDFTQRIDARDSSAIRQCSSRTLDLIMTSLGHWTQSGRLLRCELTGGLDSRAAFACLLGSGATELIEAVTSGGPESTDVRTAKHLARLAHVRHAVIPEPRPEVDHFNANATLRAFSTNGESDSKRATNALPKWAPEGAIRVEASAGEILRGFFYQHAAGVATIAPKDPTVLADLMLRRRYRRFASVPVVDEALRESLRQHTIGCFAEYSTLSPVGTDMLDLFYLFERCAGWGGHVKRASWTTSRNPFMVTAAVREAYRIPAPIGHNIEVHSAAIRRYFPASEWVLINGSRPLLLEGPGATRNAMRIGLTLARKGFDELKSRLNPATRTRSSAQSDLFAGPLYPLATDLLTASDSVAQQTMGGMGTRKVLEQHKLTKRHLGLLSYSLTHEIYYRFLLKVKPSTSSRD